MKYLLILYLVVSQQTAVLQPKLRQGIIIEKHHDDGYNYARPIATDGGAGHRDVYPVIYYIKIKGRYHGKLITDEIQVMPQQYATLKLGQVFKIKIDYD